MAAAPAAAVSPNRVTAQNLASMTCSGSLSIRGDVERPACLTLAELRCLMDAWLVTDFRCHEGWSRLGERWSAEEPQAPPRAGFPRLVGPPGWDWFLSVKSVDWIQVTREPQRATAATIALARLEG